MNSPTINEPSLARTSVTRPPTRWTSLPVPPDVVAHPPIEKENLAGQRSVTGWNLPTIVLAALKQLVKRRAFSYGKPMKGEVAPRSIDFSALACPLLNRPQPIATFKNIMELMEPEKVALESERTLALPMGLLGFERTKHYELLFRPEEEPFMWLHMKDEPKFAFLVVSPFCVHPEYQPDISPQDVDFLELSEPSEACVLNIVTMHRDGHATVNLKGPIVINRQTWIGKQVILSNATDYALQHPLPLPA